MSISISRYVDITSGVGAGNNVSTRNLGALIITLNNLCPTGSIVTFTTAAEVGAFFGTSSPEYARAEFYFGWISKNITTPTQLSFYFWNNNTATGSLIYGAEATYSLSTFTAISAGDFTLTLGGYTGHLTALNFSGAGSLSAVASTLQTAIRAVSAGGTAWTSATVTFNATNGQFNLVSGATGADTISVVAGTITDVAGPLGWLTGATLSNGTAAQTLTQALNSLLTISNNFGSFCLGFVGIQTLQNVEDAANWNNSVNPNIQFLYSYQVSPANASAWYTALNQIGGSTGTLASPVPAPNAAFTAQFFTTGVMTVSAVAYGSIAIGQSLSGPNVPSGAMVTGFDGGTGGTGNYFVNTNSAGASGSVVATPAPSQYPEMVPMMILAATDYTQRNAVQNYMFQEFALTPSVTTDALANTYDALLTNYYGQTQTAGQLLQFYQRGVMNGIATNPSDQNVYANEIWLKDAISAQIMTLLLSLSEIPANATGQAQILGAIQSIITQALFNGTISVGKTLSEAQQLYITQATGSPTAWQQVQSTGYWVNVVILPYVVNGITQYKAVYTLIYAKNDVIRLVTGTDILI